MMSTMNVEQVMVVKTELFHQCGYFQGYCDQPDSYLDRLLDPDNTQYLPRDKMELDPDYKQLIPYCIFRHIDADEDCHIFQYRRGSGQGESRLHKKKSIGIGGHISSVDAGDKSPYLLGMQRELAEEITISSSYDQKLVGLINDDRNEVGKVHLGVVHLFTVTHPAVAANEDGIIEAGFLPVQELLDQIDEFETWSQICLQALFQ